MRSILSNSHTSLAGCLGVMLGMSWVGLPIPAAAQNAAQGGEQADAAVRFTPDMARAMAGIYTREVLKRRYELPDEKIEQAQESVARRLMQLAHKIDEPGSEVIQRFVEEQFAYNAGRKDGEGGGFMPPAFGKEFADRVLPILPEVREMARGVSQDIRPMLPMKQQLKMAGDLMAFKTGMDAFETTIKKWSTGEVTDYQDPFNNRKREKPKRDENGLTERLKGARQGATSEAENPRAQRWENYLKKFEELYGLDPAQVATAESVLREYADREQRVRSDAAWRERMYQMQVWATMCWELENAWNHPAKWLIEDQAREVREPLEALEEQYKTRLESIPTSAQRQAVEQKITALLKEKGLQAPETSQ